MPGHQRLAVYGAGKRLAHLHILEHGQRQVVAKIAVAKGQVLELAPGHVPFGPIGLVQILLRAQTHHVQALGLQFQEHGGKVGDDPPFSPSASERRAGRWAWQV